MRKFLCLLLFLPLALYAATNNKIRPQTTATTSTTKPKKILIVVTSNAQLGNRSEKTGFYLSEVSHPYYIFKKHGYDIDIVSPQGGAAPRYAVDKNDAINKWFLDNKAAMNQVNHTLMPAELDMDQYVAIYYAGGTGVMWDLPNNKILADAAAMVYENGGIVAADCHGPAALLNVTLGNGNYLLQGKKVTAFSNAEEKAAGYAGVVPFSLEDALKQKGTNYTAAANFQSHIVIDGHLITGQNPASATAIAEAIIDEIKHE